MKNTASNIKHIQDVNAKLRYGEGKYVIRDNRLSISISVNGKAKLFSLKKVLTASTKEWIKKHKPTDLYNEIFSIKKSADEIGITFESFGHSVLIEHMRSVTNEEYKKDLISVFHKYLIPVFKDYEIETIKAFDIVNFVNDLKEKLSPSRIKFIKNVLNLILDHAIDNEIIERNPFNSKSVKSIKLDTTPNKEPEAYTEEEMKLILENANGWVKVLLDISFKTGARIGETMALKWSDIDLDKGIIFFKRNIHKGKVYEKKNAGGTKNHFRESYLMKSTILLLQQYYNVRPHDDWLFINRYNQPYSAPANITTYYFKPLLKKIGVKYKTIYATRATNISVSFHNGVPLSDIQQNVGHKLGSKVTEKHYLDNDVISFNKKRSKIDRLETLFLGKNNDQEIDQKTPIIEEDEKEISLPESTKIEEKDEFFHMIEEIENSGMNEEIKKSLILKLYKNSTKSS